jgi:hypothetical protein
MPINMDKSRIIVSNFHEQARNEILAILPAQAKSMDKGFKYLGFAMKPNNVFA